MKNRLLAIVCVWLVITFSTAQSQAASVPAGRSLALINLNPAKTPGPLADLLLVELGRESSLRLVEREAISRVKAEQLLANFNSGDQSGIVKLGQLLKADVFLMLEETATTNAPIVRVRLVDAWYGLQLMDFTIPNGVAGQDASLAAAIAQRVLPKLKAVPQDPAKFRLVGVGPFRSEEPAARSWDYLSESIRTGVERRLARFQDVVVLERDQLGALNAERTLAPGLPDKLLASGVLVDGAFALDRAAGPGHLKIYLRSRHSTGAPRELEFTGEVSQIDDLCRRIAKAVAGDFATSTPTNLDAALEAKLLALEAEYYLRQHEAVRASGPAEAALALAPENPQYKQLVLRSLKALTTYVFAVETNVAALLLRWSETYDRMFDLADERVIKTPASSFYGAVHSAATALLEPVPSDGLTRERTPALNLYRHLQARQRKLYDELYANADKHPMLPGFQREWLLNSAVSFGGSWHATASATLAARRVAYEKAAEVAMENHSGSSVAETVLLNDARGYFNQPLWEDLDQADALTDHFYDDLASSTNFWLRAAALQTQALRQEQLGANADFTAARRYVESLAQIAVEKIYPAYPKDVIAVHAMIWPTFVNGRFDADAKTSDAFKNDLLARYYARAPAEASIGRPPGPAPATPPPKIVYHWQKLVSLADCKMLAGLTNVGANFRRIIHTKNQLAVLAAFAYVRQKEPVNLGLVWLNPRTHQPELAQNCPVLITPRPECPFFLQNDPDWAAAGDEVCLGTPNNGLLILSRSHPPEVLDMDHGLVANSIWQPATIGRKLYALVNPNWRYEYEGVMELDLSNHVSRTLFSTRDKRRTGLLSGTVLLGLAADAAHNRLWILKPGEICTHDLATDADQVEIFPTLRDRNSYMGADVYDFRGYGETLVNNFLRWPSLINLPTRKLVELPGNFSQYHWLSGRVVPNRQGAVAFNWGALQAWQPGNDSVDVLVHSTGRDPGELRDVCPTPEGMLVLTENALYRVPEL